MNICPTALHRGWTTTWDGRGSPNGRDTWDDLPFLPMLLTTHCTHQAGGRTGQSPSMGVSGTSVAEGRTFLALLLLGMGDAEDNGACAHLSCARLSRSAASIVSAGRAGGPMNKYLTRAASGICLHASTPPFSVHARAARDTLPRVPRAPHSHFGRRRTGWRRTRTR